MKRIRFICLGSILWCTAADAQMIVSDPLTETNTLQSLVREAVAAEKRVAMINNQIAQLIQIKNTVAAVSHGNLAALSNLVPELGALGLTMPLGHDTSALVRAMSGTAGGLGATASLTQNLLSTNQFYAPAGTDLRAMMINQTALSVAAANAAAQTALNSNTQRLTYLNTLRNGLGPTPDVKAATDATARLAGEKPPPRLRPISSWRCCSYRRRRRQRAPHRNSRSGAARSTPWWRGRGQPPRPPPVAT